MRWRLGVTLALLLGAFTLAGAEDVPISHSQGVWKMPVRLNGTVTLDFVVDSGAATVCIPADVFATLQRSGTLRASDMLPDVPLLMANGSTERMRRFVLTTVAVGDHVVRHVTATVMPSSSPLLLGESFLEQLPPWQLDTRRGVFHIGEELPGAPTAAVESPASAVRAFFIALNQEDHRQCWRLLDLYSQDRIASKVAAALHVTPEQAHDMLASDDPSLYSFWSSLRTSARADLYVTFEFSDGPVTGTSAVVNATGPDGVVALQGRQEADGWKFGLVETNEALTRKSP